MQPNPSILLAGRAGIHAIVEYTLNRVFALPLRDFFFSPRICQNLQKKPEFHKLVFKRILLFFSRVQPHWVTYKWSRRTTMVLTDHKMDLSVVILLSRVYVQNPNLILA